MLVVEIWIDNGKKSEKIHELTATNKGRKASVVGGTSYEGMVNYETHRCTMFEHDTTAGALRLARKMLNIEIERERKKVRR
tara:strand:+ start:1858 stop:2100 length:243 start_codon:yes stop_codon:yes gene_type:complete